jgi:tyrosyl-DNA phosphodiesterase 2
MECALKYLETLVSTDDGSDAAAIIIVLQEMTNLGINQVKSTAWVRERYAITDIDISRFDSSYGVMTLIPRCLAVTNAFRVRWQSRFGRDGLFVDIRLPKTRGASHFIRLCNTHLESLPSDPPMRPIQVCMANRYLHEAGIHGSVFAGDMNSEEPSDNDIARVELCESRELHLFLKWKLQV